MTQIKEKQISKTMPKRYEFPIPITFWDNLGIFIPKGPFIPPIKTEDMPNVIILCGIPTSGKSTWAKKFQSMQYYPGDDFRSYRIVSRDVIREQCFKQPYQITKENENEVTRIFDKMITDCIKLKKPIILDNTHCKEAYLKAALKTFAGTGYAIKIKFFDLPLWKAYYRNIKRRLLTGKWIPVKVIKAMKTNYDKINRKNYDQYAI